MREQIIQKVLDKKIVAIVRGVYDEDCVNLAKALCAGGIELLEVTFDQSKPEALVRTSDTIRRLVEELGDKMAFGAGTVTSLEMLELAKNAGAQFIVSPGLSVAVAKICAEKNIPYYPGCVTPTEIMQALELGITTVKFFPANVYGGLKALKALSGPFPQVKFIPTGGVDRSNIDEFLAFDKIAAIGGSFFVKEALEKMEAEK